VVMVVMEGKKVTLRTVSKMHMEVVETE